MANDPASWLKEFARRVLEAEQAAGSKTESRGAFAACEKLRHPLRKMLGAEGFQSLLSRAVALTGAKTPWLLALKAKSDGMLGGLEELRPKPDPRTLAEGEALILGELLGLLITFIGPSITLGLTQEIWPALKIWKT